VHDDFVAHDESESWSAHEQRQREIANLGEAGDVGAVTLKI